MRSTGEVIALAGVGNLGKYFCEELTADDRYEVIVITRKNSAWLVEQDIDIRISDYSEDSILSILDSTNSTALISLINCSSDSYFDIHYSLLNACTRSKTCKRFIPSEWIGNVEGYPHLPRFYGTSREPFRQVLEQSQVQWTLFNGGWLMDYLLPKEKTYMPPIPDEFPIDPNGWKACIRGTGDEVQSFTWARDIARAVLELLAAPRWEKFTYVCGEWCTFNDVIKQMECWKGTSMEKTYKPNEEFYKVISESKQGLLTPDLELAMIEEWMVAGASACPKPKTLLQQEKYFKGITFSSIYDLISNASEVDFI